MAVKVLGVFKAATDTRDVPAGTVIFEAGSTGEEMYGVAEGTVELRLPDGRAVTIGPDETFGEMALVDRSRPQRDRDRVGGLQAGRHRQAAVPLPGPRDAHVRAPGHGQPGGEAARHADRRRAG